MKERESRAYNSFERTLRSKEAQERTNKDISLLPLKDQIAYWKKVEEEEALERLKHKKEEDEPVRFGNPWREEWIAAQKIIEDNANGIKPEKPKKEKKSSKQKGSGGE